MGMGGHSPCSHQGCQPGARSRPRSGLICGAITSQYLLEKSRVVFQVGGEGVPISAPPAPPAAHTPAWSSCSQAKSERNYHIFYEMLAGLPAQQRQRYCLQGAETYYYLNQVASPPPPDPPTLPTLWRTAQAQVAGRSWMGRVLRVCPQTLSAAPRGAVPGGEL